MTLELVREPFFYDDRCEQTADDAVGERSMLC